MDYVKKWSPMGGIESDAQAFIDQTQNLFGALGQRVEKENDELYPLLDKAEGV